MTKIIAISDTHNLHPTLSIPDGDIIIHVGDATNRGTFPEFSEFISWYGSLLHPHKIFIAGNHDRGLDGDLRGPIINLMKEHGIIYLENSNVIIDNVKIWGSPYSLEFGSWSFGKSQKEIFNVWQTIPEDIHFNIIATHSPPFGILDSNNLGHHLGCQELAKRIDYLKPSYHLFGHIHESKGKKIINNITYINVSQMKADYSGLLNKPIIITI